MTSSSRWTRRKARWYARAVEAGDYVRAVVDALAPLLEGIRSVIDVGAGTGALSRELFDRGLSVTAVEPSPAMGEELHRHMGERTRSDRFRFVAEGWDGLDLPRHDLLLLAHVPGGITRERDFLVKASGLARRIALVRNAGPWNKFFYDELYPLILGRPWKPRGDYIDDLAALHEAGVYADVKLFSFTLDQPFDDFADALGFWTDRLDAEGKEDLLEAFLRQRLEPEGRGYIARFGRRRSALLWWDTDVPPEKTLRPGRREGR